MNKFRDSDYVSVPEPELIVEALEMAAIAYGNSAPPKGNRKPDAPSELVLSIVIPCDPKGGGDMVLNLKTFCGTYYVCLKSFVRACGHGQGSVPVVKRHYISRTRIHSAHARGGVLTVSSVISGQTTQAQESYTYIHLAYKVHCPVRDSKRLFDGKTNMGL